MKKYIMLLIGITTGVYAASGFKSTQDTMDAIFNTYNTVLQAPNLYDKTVSLNEITQLCDTLNAHIMKKQGLLVGKKSARKGAFQGSCALDRTYIDKCDNLFDLWDIHI